MGLFPSPFFFLEGVSKVELPLVMTPRMVAEQLSVCRLTVYKMIQSGELKSLQVDRFKHHRIHRDTFLEYVERLRNGTTRNED